MNPYRLDGLHAFNQALTTDILSRFTIEFLGVQSRPTLCQCCNALWLDLSWSHESARQSAPRELPPSHSVQLILRFSGCLLSAIDLWVSTDRINSAQRLGWSVKKKKKKKRLASLEDHPVVCDTLLIGGHGTSAFSFLLTASLYTIRFGESMPSPVWMYPWKRTLDRTIAEYVNANHDLHLFWAKDTVHDQERLLSPH